MMSAFPEVAALLLVGKPHSAPATAAWPTSPGTALVPLPSQPGVAHADSLARTMRLIKPQWGQSLHSDGHHSRGDFAQASKGRCRLGLQWGEQRTELPVSKGTSLQ